MRLLNRREFTGLCSALGSLAASSRASALDVATGATSPRAGRTVKLRDGTLVPALGQGSWHLGQGRRPPAVEEEALRTGLSLGMTLIDTAEVYGEGRSEQFVGRVIASQRDRVFLVTKVWPSHAGGNGMVRACDASLARLGTDHLDLYLLHWPDWPPGRREVTDFSGVVTGFESLRAAGKIRAWGVSNFSIKDMENLFRVPHGDRCTANQVLYNVGSRGIEYDLLPWCEKRGVAVMAYTPLGRNLLHDPVLTRIGQAHGCSVATVALAWAIRGGNVIAIPESGLAAHVKENALALSLTLTPQELQSVDAAHPPPDRAVPLDHA